jgi:hypothetical protein
MSQFTEGFFTTEDVTAQLRKKNDEKAGFGVLAALVRLKAANARMQEYIDAAAHAYETLNTAEAEGIAMAIRSATITMGETANHLDAALHGEMQRARAA